ncbi:MAG: hypothetical protein ABEK01_00480 [Candidatus Nanohaloarchaea archaeon]
MSEESSDDLLAGTVDEVKEKIREADNPDLTSLLSDEKEGKDRKTVKDFIESLMEGEEDQEEESSEENPTDEVEEDKESEEPVESATEPSTDFFSGLSSEVVFVGGITIGLLVGLAVAVGSGMMSAPSTTAPGGMASVQDVNSSITELLSAGGSMNTTSVTGIEERNGIYEVNLTSQVTVGNQTRTRTTTYYVTGDGEKLISGYGIQMVDIQETIDRVKNSKNQQSSSQQ